MDQEEGAFMGKKKRRASSVHKEFLGDYLNIASNPIISRMLSRTGEVVHFADIVAKVNKRNKMQDRVLIITDQAIYNIDPSSFKVKRRIQLQDLEGMSMSTQADNFFILHVPKEYDYLYVSRRKTEIALVLLSRRHEFEATAPSSSGTSFPIVFADRIRFKSTNSLSSLKEIEFSKVDDGVITTILKLS